MYVYDAQGRLSSIATGDGVTLANTYDGSLLAQQTVSGPFTHALNKSYDNLLRASGWNIDGASPIAIGRDGDGNVATAAGMTVTRGTTGLIKSVSSGAISDTFSYNAYGELIGHSVSGSVTSYSASYTRDAAGRVETKTETIGAVSHSESYGYDDAGRLSQVFVDGSSTPTREYSYDGNANRDDGTYDLQDRQISHAGFTYSYGPNGELSKRVDDSSLAETAYNYDSVGNLRSVTRPVPLTDIAYVIDGNNRRIGKRVGTALVQGFVYDGSRIIAELDGTGTVVSRFVYATHSHSPDLVLKGGTIHRFIKDHLGSPRLVVDSATGAVVQRIDYDEWGNVSLDTNPGFQPFGFAGGLWDRDTGLVRFGARDYNAATGRWTTKDSSRWRGGLNFYSYCGDDPVNYVDETGHAAVAVAGVGVVGGGATAAVGLAVGYVGAGAAAIGLAAWDIVHDLDDFEHPTIVYGQEDLSEEKEKEMAERERCLEVEGKCADKCSPLMGQGWTPSRPKGKKCRGRSRPPGGGIGLQSDFLDCYHGCLEEHGCR